MIRYTTSPHIFNPTSNFSFTPSLNLTSTTLKTCYSYFHLPNTTMAHHPRHSAMLSISTTTSATDKLQHQPSPPHPPSQNVPTATQSTSPGLRVPSNRKTIYDRHLNRTRSAELSRASFAFLFAEMVTYAQRRVTGIQDLEKRYFLPLSSIHQHPP